LKDILEKIKEYQNGLKAVFIDELIEPNTQEHSTDHDIIENLQYFWVAPRDKWQPKLIENDQDPVLESFQLTKGLLKNNMRNSNEVANFANEYCLNDDIRPLLPKVLRNFPNGKEVEHIQDRIECIKNARIAAHKGVLIIVGTIVDHSFLTNLRHLIKEEEEEAIGVLATVHITRDFEQSHGLKIKKFYSEDQSIIDFLEKKGNILFVSAGTIAGFEWPSVVCIGKMFEREKPHTEHFVNAYLRSTVDLHVSKADDDHFDLP